MSVRASTLISAILHRMLVLTVLSAAPSPTYVSDLIHLWLQTAWDWLMNVVTRDTCLTCKQTTVFTWRDADNQSHRCNVGSVVINVIWSKPTCTAFVTQDAIESFEYLPTTEAIHRMPVRTWWVARSYLCSIVTSQLIAIQLERR